MPRQAMTTSVVCPDCGGPKYRYAKFCKSCSFKGSRNANFGRAPSAETREKMRAAALARPKESRERRHAVTTEAREKMRTAALARSPRPVCSYCLSKGKHAKGCKRPTRILREDAPLFS